MSSLGWCCMAAHPLADHVADVTLQETSTHMCAHRHRHRRWLRKLMHVCWTAKALRKQISSSPIYSIVQQPAGMLLTSGLFLSRITLMDHENFPCHAHPETLPQAVALANSRCRVRPVQQGSVTPRSLCPCLPASPPSGLSSARLRLPGRSHIPQTPMPAAAYYCTAALDDESRRNRAPAT
eukprot:360874-Chlamydomonas_euryale.AAC.4